MSERDFKGSSGKKRNIVFAFETSCDETCAAAVEECSDGHLEILSNIVSSQIDIHKLYGGVVPEIASRNHLMTIENVAKEALRAANISVADVTRVAATVQPGLVGAVMVGRVFAESFAAMRRIPFAEVNHLVGHIASVMLSNPGLQTPFVCLVVSGGHTSLYKVESSLKCKVLSETLDDACGEAFDKVAKVLGLGYPGGPAIASQAENYKQRKQNESCNLADLKLFNYNPIYSKNANFSYSGLKSAVIDYVKKNPDYDIAEVCAVFQHEAIEQLVVKSKAINGELPLAVCGGVAANEYLRAALPDAYFPRKELCGDNAAMIAAAAIIFPKIKLF